MAKRCIVHMSFFVIALAFAGCATTHNKVLADYLDSRTKDTVIQNDTIEEDFQTEIYPLFQSLKDDFSYLDDNVLHNKLTEISSTYSNVYLVYSRRYYDTNAKRINVEKVTVENMNIGLFSYLRQMTGLNDGKTKFVTSPDKNSLIITIEYSDKSIAVILAGGQYINLNTFEPVSDTWPTQAIEKFDSIFDLKKNKYRIQRGETTYDILIQHHNSNELLFKCMLARYFLATVDSTAIGAIRERKYVSSQWFY